ncbi:hypothetical protein MNVI_38770 [Mycobacterium noviomagense]|uniref:DUF2752 domain-containing protein n=1 Tax=Mycobacterium noviomagense TaxID=459858 RepID=A0A7I7PJ53_9MYCO|nr:hypothetical protein BST37_09865 [Mycobacterium noviomagense]BBY08559.1 hypothetical protein MNVI_38770 [Mycobacterium noviomagense]
MARNLPSTTRRRLYGAVGSSALLAAFTTYVGLADPHNPHSLFPLCPFKLLTGWNCPACGGLRMVHDVLHGDLLAAVSDNIFLIVGLPMLTVWILLRRRHQNAVLPIAAVATIAAAAIAWTVLRNLPGFPLIPTVTGG